MNFYLCQHKVWHLWESVGQCIPLGQPNSIKRPTCGRIANTDGFLHQYLFRYTHFLFSESEQPTFFGRFRTADKMRARRLEMVKESGLVSSLYLFVRKPNNIVLIIFRVVDYGGIRPHPDRWRCALFPCQRPPFYRIFFRLSRRHDFLFGPRPSWRRATRIYRSKVIDNDYTRAQW